MNRTNNINANPMQMIQQFQNFKNTFHGNPKEEVQKLVSSGKISQAQLNKFQQMASQFQQMFGIR